MSTTVSAARTEAEREDVYRFRYHIYVEEMGLEPPGTDHANERVRDGLDDESIDYVARVDGAVMGAVRLTHLEDVSDPAPLVEKFQLQPAIDAFGKETICMTSRFMLDPSLRHGTAVLGLIELMWQEAVERGLFFNFGDCSPHMLPFYEHLGYRRYTRAYNDTAFGYKVPIVMLRDHEWFRRVRSPMLRVVLRTPDVPAVRTWFEHTFPDYLDLESATFLPGDTFFEILTRRVAGDPLHSVALLRGLDRDEAALFMKEASLIQAQSGDKIVREGDRDDTLYVLLSGLVEVTVGDAPDRPLTVLGSGDCFGEMGFLTAEPRTATVTAQAPSEVLVLNGPFLRRLIAEKPQLAAKVLLNLSQILCRRLATTTRARDLH